MLRLTKKQHKPYSSLYPPPPLFPRLYCWVRQSVLAYLNCTVLVGNPLSGRSRWFLSYIATVPHMNLYVMQDMLKVNFLQTPSMFTIIQYTARSCWYRSPKVQITPPNSSNIARGKCSRLVRAKWQMSSFLIVSQHIGLWPMHCRTPSKECNYYVT